MSPTIIKAVARSLESSRDEVPVRDQTVLAALNFSIVEECCL